MAPKDYAALAVFTLIVMIIAEALICASHYFNRKK